MDPLIIGRFARSCMKSAPVPRPDAKLSSGRDAASFNPWLIPIADSRALETTTGNLW
jgi:hypothetical protein